MKRRLVLRALGALFGVVAPGALARELVAEKVDVIHAVFPGAVRADRVIE